MSLTFLWSALQSARGQLYDLGGDVSYIDDALQQATSLRVDAVFPKDRSSNADIEDIQIPQAKKNVPAGSLLARGSAIDLQSIQDGVKLQESWDSPLTARAGHNNNEPSPKRRRLGTADNHEIYHQHASNLHSLQQRLGSRDAMPPPSRHPPKNQQQSGLWSSSQSRGPEPHLIETLDAHRPLPYLSKPYNEGTTGSHISSPILGETATGSKPRLMLSRAHSTLSRSIGERDNDGELDRVPYSTFLGRRSSGLPTTRLTLPPSTPSAFKHTSPLHRVGISANARTSQPPFLTPESSSSLQERFRHRNPAHNNNQIIASPHFSNQTIPSLHSSTQRPYTNNTTFPPASKSITSTPRINNPSTLPSTNHSPHKFSWLPALRGHAERQDQQRPHAEEPQSGSSAYRHPIRQPLSLNSFSFANKPQIGTDIVGRRSDDIGFVNNHRRRAVRR